MELNAWMHASGVYVLSGSELPADLRTSGWVPVSPE